MKTQLKVGLIGAGFIGRSHALALSAVGMVFSDCPIAARRHVLCDVDPARAAASAETFGFAASTTDWRQAVDESDAVIIAVPSVAHAEIARRAIAQKKPFLCEKPVGLSSAEAYALGLAAEQAGVPTATGFTYLRAPMIRHASEILDSGRMGRPVHFYGRHFEDYLSDPDAPFGWRLDASLAGRCGALGDLGCHIISVGRLLLGPVEALCGATKTVHPNRPVGPGGQLRRVENEDHATALVRFVGGVPGVIEVSRIATGRKMDIAFEVTCERGAIRFDGERANELQVYFAEPGSPSNGFRRVLIEPAHPGYAGFLPAAAHGIGFNDLKTIEIDAFLRTIAGVADTSIGLIEAARIGRVCEAIIDSSAAARWIENPETLH